MRGMPYACLALLVAACANAPPQPQLLPADHNGPPELPAANPHPDPMDISTERMSEVTRVLASDEFQGRSMGTPGEEKTISYLIQQFHMAGLEPGGENGTWTQTVPMIRTKLQSPMSFSVKQGATTTPLRFPDDIYLSTVRDTTAPAIKSLTASPATINQNNGKMVPVTITANVTDAADTTPTTRIVSVSGNENVTGEWQITGALTLQVRARRGGKTSRVYTVTVESRDDAGNASTKTVTVTVR